MADTTPQTAAGKVLWHFSISLDGFVAGPGHDMDWMVGTSRDGLIAEYTATTGAVLGGRNGWDAAPGARPYGGGDAWQGSIFVLTHHPEDAAPADDVTFLSCDVADAVRIGLEAAGGKNLEVHSPSIGAQLLERGLIDEIDLHVMPVLLGDGIRLYDVAGTAVVNLQNLVGDDRDAVTNLRFRPTYEN